jgi:predicted transcriptional regulator
MDLDIKLGLRTSFFEQAKVIAKKLDNHQFEGKVNSLQFSSLELLLKSLSSNRWVLLRCLKGLDKSSIRALSLALKRDYKAVYNDVMALLAIGLIERDEAGLLSVPWNNISAQTDLLAA